MNRCVLRVQHLLVPVLLGLWQGGTPAKADTITGVFSNVIAAGNVLNDPTVGTSTYLDNTGTIVVGTATPGGAACTGANTLCWGSDPGVGLPDNQQYSELVFTGATSFNSSSGATQNIGTISFLNGTSALTSLIFGATLSLYDNGDFVGADSIIINTTSNQYSGTGLTLAELNTDADYINICGNDSNICASSIEAYEDSEGGTGLLVDLSGNLVGDPTLDLDNVAVDPSEAGCTTCGVVGNEQALGVTPEPPAFVLMSTALVLFAGLGYGSRLRRAGVTSV